MITTSPPGGSWRPPSTRFQPPPIVGRRTTANTAGRVHMLHRGRGVATGAAALALSAVAAGGVVAATQSSDDAALRPVRQPASRGIERRVDALVNKMTVDEKLEQLQLLSDGQITDQEAKNGVGGVFSLTDPARIDHYQHIA